MGNNLKQIMRDLISESNDEIFLKLSDNDVKTTSTFSFIPEFNESNIISKTKKKKVVNFKKIVYNYKNKIIKLSSYKVVAIILKNIIRKKHKAFEKKIVINLEEFVQKTILDFIISYQNELKFRKSNVKTFELTFSKLNNFIQNEIFTVFCFTTLRNFDSNTYSLSLPRGLTVRLRTEEEAIMICDIKDAKTYPKINPNFQKIKFILGGHILKTEINEQKIKERFEKFLFALKIFHEGNVQFGGIYYSDSVNWEVKPTICIKSEPILGKSASKYRLESANLTQKDFEKFVTEFFKINLTKGKYVFLGRSIKRFSQAIEDENNLDKIIDFIICLESLYSSKEQQLSFRFAMRVASVLGQASRQKIKIQEFILQIYNLRSKIIHGDVIPAVEIDDTEIHLDDCVKLLENITRTSIKLFLQLIIDFKTKEELHGIIDNSIYDLKLQKVFLINLKKMKPQLDVFDQK